MTGDPESGSSCCLKLGSTWDWLDSSTGLESTFGVQPHHCKNQWVSGNIKNLANISVHLLGASGVVIEHLLYTRLCKNKFSENHSFSQLCVKTSSEHLLGDLQCISIHVSIIVTN